MKLSTPNLISCQRGWGGSLPTKNSKIVLHATTAVNLLNAFHWSISWKSSLAIRCNFAPAIFSAQWAKKLHTLVSFPQRSRVLHQPLACFRRSDGKPFVFVVFHPPLLQELTSRSPAGDASRRNAARPRATGSGWEMKRYAFIKTYGDIWWKKSWTSW